MSRRAKPLSALCSAPGVLRKREDERGLGGFLGRRGRPPDQNEAGNVLFVVLNLLCGDLETEDLRGAQRRHCAGIGALPFRDHLRATGGVVHRDDLDAGNPGEILLALRQRLRVRVHDREILEARSGPDQQTVVHGEFHFPDDRQLVLDEQVVVPMDASPIEFSIGRIPRVARPSATAANTSSKLRHGITVASGANRSAAASL